MYIPFDRGSHIPERLVHRVMTTDSAATGAVIGTHHNSLRVLDHLWKEQAGLPPMARTTIPIIIIGAESYCRWPPRNLQTVCDRLETNQKMGLALRRSAG